MQYDTNNLILFTDFDGTVSTGDVGNRLFHRFSNGRSDGPVKLWLEGKIDSRQCLIEEAAVMDDITGEELNRFIDSFQIDPHFAGFVEFVRDNQIPLYILSDGLDIYIDRLLTQNGLKDIPYFANQARLKSGRLQFEWPYFDHSCGNCANCKGHHIRRLRAPHQKAVYIGDGKSDLCALPEADLIFAKSYLADYCRQNKIDFYPFGSFADISETVKSLIGKRQS